MLLIDQTIFGQYLVLKFQFQASRRRFEYSEIGLLFTELTLRSGCEDKFIEVINQLLSQKLRIYANDGGYHTEQQICN